MLEGIPEGIPLGIALGIAEVEPGVGRAVAVPAEGADDGD